MESSDILEILKNIPYPGFNRDIVSFGMVDDVQVDGREVRVRLKISTQQEDKKNSVIEAVRDALTNTGSFDKVEVSVAEGSPATPVGGPAPSSLPGVKHVLAVASGKGGVGKSTVAANLACSLKRREHSVGLLDLDIYGPSLPIILGIQEQPKTTPDRKLIPIDHAGLKVMSFGFISGNDTPAIWRGPLVARMTEQFFRDVEWGELDFLVLDLPPGTGDVQLTLTQKLRISGAIIVTTPQDLALADVRKGADMFRKVQAPVLGVIENMSGLQIDGNVSTTDSSITIAGRTINVDQNGNFSVRLDLFKRGGGKTESERLDVPMLGEIPISQEIMESTDSGTPIVISLPDSPVSKVYHQITEKILSALQN